MITLPAFIFIFLLCRRRGQNGWLWAGLYLAVGVTGVLASSITKVWFLCYIISGSFLVIFSAWYWLANDDMRKEMDSNKAAMDREEQEAEEEHRRNLAEWRSIKVYTDTTQSRELLLDKQALIEAGITPYYTNAGFVSLMVHQSAEDKAREIVGTQPLDESTTVDRDA